MTQRYVFVYESGPQNWSGFAPDVPGCASTGGTTNELRRNLGETLAFHLEGLALGGTVLPQAATHVIEVLEGGAAEWIEVELPVREVVSA